jgi:indole-3-glycerol phosphate synthase
MSNSSVLDQIIEGVLADVKAREKPISELVAKLDEAPKLRDATAALSKPGTRLIAEVKRSSPSKGVLAEITDPAELAIQYQTGGADVISVLTEQRRFNGSIPDLISVRNKVSIPVLRKDFIVTEFQIYESRLIGADLILLIVAGLSKSQLTDYYQLATELGMSVLVEVHDEIEAAAAVELKAKIIGVNSRNLKTLEVSSKNFDRIFPHLPSNVIKMAESGISTRAQVEAVENLGANAILVGETLVKAADPASKIKELLNR